MVEDFGFLWCRLAICELVHYPVSVKEFECAPRGKLCGASVCALEIFNRDKFGAMCFCVERRKQAIVFDGAKVALGALPVFGVDDITVIQIVGRKELCVSILQT